LNKEGRNSPRGQVCYPKEGYFHRNEWKTAPIVGFA
jgi:hypothetical protein